MVAEVVVEDVAVVIGLERKGSAIPPITMTLLSLRLPNALLLPGTISLDDE